MSYVRKYLTYAKAKHYILQFQFKTISEYTQYVKNENITFLPLKPFNTYYIDGFKAHDFLGLDEKTYKANLTELRNAQCTMMRTKVTPESHLKKCKPRKKNSVIQPVIQPVALNRNFNKGLDPDKVIAFLIKEDVAPETIVNMVAELDIKSSTLMNDLCKYMQDRSKRQAEVWRPIGYTTAEAQMTTKI